MKPSTLLLSLLLIPGILLSQINTKDSLHLQNPVKNELKLNMLELLIMPAIGITYEHYLNPSSSYGVYGFINFNINEGYRYEKFEIAPFYRIYFQNRDKLDNKGLYTEVFSGLNVGETDFFDYDYDTNRYGDLYTQEYVGISLGVTLGYKFVNHNNYAFEIFAGAGRFLNEQEIDAYPRIGLSIGKRF
jgi:hypothetical protein